MLKDLWWEHVSKYILYTNGTVKTQNKTFFSGEGGGLLLKCYTKLLFSDILFQLNSL